MICFTRFLKLFVKGITLHVLFGVFFNFTTCLSFIKFLFWTLSNEDENKENSIASPRALIIQQWTSTKRQSYPGSFIHFPLSFLSTFPLIWFLTVWTWYTWVYSASCFLRSLGLSVIIFGNFLFITSNILHILCVCWGILGGSDCKESVCSAGDPGSIPWSGRSPAEGNGNPVQDSCLGNPMDRGACWATVCGVTKNGTRLSDLAGTHGIPMIIPDLQVEAGVASGNLVTLPRHLSEKMEKEARDLLSFFLTIFQL